MGLAACEQGRRVRYATTAQLVNELAEAADNRQLSRVLATGEAAWQEVFHFHTHVVPRWHGDDLRLMWSSLPAPGREGRIDAVGEVNHDAFGVHAECVLTTGR